MAWRGIDLFATDVREYALCVVRVRLQDFVHRANRMCTCDSVVEGEPTSAWVYAMETQYLIGNKLFRSGILIASEQEGRYSWDGLLVKHRWCSLLAQCHLPNVNHTNDHSGRAGPLHASSRGDDPATTLADPLKTRFSCVSLAYRIRGD
jgi:hypothetical protein